MNNILKLQTSHKHFYNDFNGKYIFVYKQEIIKTRY